MDKMLEQRLPGGSVISQESHGVFSIRRASTGNSFKAFFTAQCLTEMAKYVAKTTEKIMPPDFDREALLAQWQREIAEDK